MKVAVVEDEKKLARSLKEGLEAEGYAVDVFYDGESAQEELGRTGGYSLAILDLMLPRKSGLEVCTDLRAGGSALPVLILTARDSAEEKVEALDSGADDFLTKPFSFDELLARMRALSRRSLTLKPELLSVADVQVNTGTRRVTRAGAEVLLTPTEFDLLHLLLANAGRALSREDISARLWGEDGDSGSNVVDVHVRNLRKKIDDNYGIKIIRTVRGMGYAVEG